MLVKALGPAQRLVVRALQAVLLAGTLAFTVWTVLSGPHETNVLLDGWLSNALTCVGGLLCFTRATMVKQERVAWASMGAALVVSSAADTYWFSVVRHLDPEPYPSPSDAGWLAFFPFVYVAVVLLVRARVPRFYASVWFDGVVGGLGAGAIAAAIAFQTILDTTGGSTAAVAVNLAYPIGDLLLLVLVVGVLALLGWRPDRTWWLLAAGMLVYGIADTFYLFLVATDTYQSGQPVDAGFVIAQTTIGFAAWQATAEQRALRLEGWAVLIMPTLFTLTSIGVLVLDHFHRVSTVAVVLATGTLLAVVVRTAVTFREVRTLTESRRQARTDDLTGLGNRRLLYSQLDAALEARADDQVVALLLIDLDRFKEVNDALGHQIGDRLLREIGARLAEQLAPKDVLVRLGGDEFAVLLTGERARQGCETAECLLQSLQAPFDLDGVALHADASIGVALCPDHAGDATVLLQPADVAMYQAKATRGGWQLYVSARHEDSRNRLQTIEDLRSAVSEGRLVLHYQPKIELRSGAVLGVEALVRWARPGQGLLYPDTFLPLAEHAGLMRSLTLVVLESAMQQCEAWRRQRIDMPVAVNLSVANLLDAHLPENVAGFLQGFGLPPRLLELELTESTLMADPVRSKAVLGELRELGVRIAVDDYGTGYSSLAYLQDLAVDELKLDKSFVLRMTTDPGAAAIVRTTIDLAHALGLCIVAEGVEDAETLEELARLDCDVAQGFHIKRPGPAADLTRWLATRSAPISSTSPIGR